MVAKEQILDPDKVSRVLGVKWRHLRIPDEDGKDKKDRYDTSSFIYDLPNNLVLSFHSYFSPYSVTLFSDKESELFNISFENITGVKYLFEYKVLILESKQRDYYSQLWISSKGVFRMRVGVSISDYNEYAWINSMGDGRKGELYRR